MQSKRDDLVPVAEALFDLGGPVQALRDASPQALHQFTTHLVTAFTPHLALGLIRPLPQ